MKQIYFLKKIVTVSLVLAFSAGLINSAKAVGWTNKSLINANGGLSFKGGTAWGSGTTGYVLPGILSSNAYNMTLRKYSASGDSWTNSSVFGSNRQDAVSFAIGDSGFIATGYDGTTTQNDLWVFQTNNALANFEVWTQKASLPSGYDRRNAVAFASGGKGYIATGVNSSSTNLNDLWQYDPVSNTWTAKANFPGSARYGAVAFSIGNKGYVGTGNDGSPQNDIYEYNTSTDTWTAKASVTGTRYYAVGFTIGNKGYVGTGNDGTSRLRDFYEYDASGNSWTAIADFGTGLPGGNFVTSDNLNKIVASNGVDQAVGFSIGTKGYVGSGSTNGTNRLFTFMEYTPTDAFVTLSLSSSNYVPGSQINVYYGAAGTTSFNSGNVFTAYLSNDGFSTEVAIGSITSQSATGVISAIIPTGTATGNTYRVRVKSSNPAQTTSNDNGIDFNIVSPAHLDFKLQSCSQPTPNTIEFEVYVKNDGVSSVDVRANSFQFGVNFNTAILQSGATITPSYLGLNDFTGLNGYSFPSSTFPEHIRFVEGAFTGGVASTPIMNNGQSYRIGKFRLTSSANWVATPTANLTLETGSIAGKTSTAGIVYLGGDASSSTSISDPGSGNLQLTTSGCALALNQCTVAATASATNITCAGGGSDGSATVTASGGFDPYSYSWSNGATTSSQSGLSVGIYYVTVTDAISCTATASAIVTTSICNTNLNLTLYIQGYYKAGMMTDVLSNEGVGGAGPTDVDTIQVTLHDATSPYAAIESQKVVLQTNGSALAVFSPLRTGNSYYIEVTHRSAIKTWSAAPVLFALNTSYDFSTAASQAYGNNQADLLNVSNNPTGVFGLYSADINQDENVDLLDFPALDYGINQGLFGYNLSDLNGDGNTDGIDFAGGFNGGYFHPNLQNGRFAHYPY